MRQFEGYSVQDRYPVVYRFARYLIENNFRGGWRLIRLAKQLGLLDRFVSSQIVDNTEFLFPLFIYPRNYLDLSAYEFPVVDALARKVNALGPEVHFVDCGADIGLIAHLLMARCKNISLITSIEPNDTVFPILEHNLCKLGIQTCTVSGAVSDFVGRGSLVNPKHDKSFHARYVVPSDPGDFDVHRVDDLLTTGEQPLAIKIDVEGAEISVVRGSQAALEATNDFVVVFEAHYKQIERTGIDPIDIVRLIQSTRDCEATVSELGGQPINCRTGFFDQVPDTNRVYNIVCATV